jgi:hypothetical protein
VHRNLLAVALATAVLAMTATVLAQQTDGRIIGTVVDPNGGVLPGATITIVSSALT